jgi:hypothetical protein
MDQRKVLHSSVAGVAGLRGERLRRSALRATVAAVTLNPAVRISRTAPIREPACTLMPELLAF